MDALRTGIEIACGLCGFFAAYAYAGYPATVWLCAKLFGRRCFPAAVRDEDLPAVSLLVAAHNEEAFIPRRIENALALDFPAGKLEVVIATDGCSDRTAELARQFARFGVRVFEYPQRRGKVSVLNDTIPQLRGEIVLLSDANTFMEPLAARHLARWFTDPRVGVVCGKLELTDPATGRNADGLYWKYETFMKRCEGRLGALLGCNGGIYAIRRAVFSPLRTDTIVDDFILPLDARLRTGCRVEYDGDAVAREESAPNLKGEFRRRARIGAGGFQSLVSLWRLLDPRQGWVAFCFLSHKVLRWLCPFMLAGLLIGAAVLADDSRFRVLLAVQLIFYSLSAVVAFLPLRGSYLRPLLLPAMFTGMNLAILVGFLKWVIGGQSGIWQRTARVA